MREEAQGAVPPDYSGHSYVPPLVKEEAEDLPVPPEADAAPPGAGTREEPSVPAGRFGSERDSKKGGKRGEIFGGILGEGGLLSRVPFLSSLLPPPRGEGEGRGRHGALWDYALLALVALCFLDGKTDDILPILLLLLLWD